MEKLHKITGAIPYLLVIFLNTFVDLGHKITIQNTLFKVYDGNTQIILTAIVNGLILLPFILMFSPAGFIGDRYPKNKVIKGAAAAAVVLTLGITVCYYGGFFWCAFAMTFLLAIQSALYSPAKYGYIKLMFGKEHLAESNGLVQVITIGALLISTFVFSLFFESMFPVDSPDKSDVLRAVAPIGWLLVANSLLELFFAYKLPELDAGSDEKFVMKDYITGRAVVKNLKPVVSNSTIRLSIIGLAVFWSVGQVMLAAFPSFAKETMAIENTMVIQGILAGTGLGLGLGAFLAARWSRNYIETGLVPIGAVGIAVSLLILPSVTNPWFACIIFMSVGVMGGLFIVPLNALIQFNAKSEQLGRVIAGNNLIQNISMAGFLLLTVTFAMAGFSSKSLLILTALVAVVGCGYTVYKLPQSLLRLFVGALLKQRYRINVQGLKNLPGQGGVLLLGNHISWIDWAIVQIASPRPVRFVMLKSIYKRWYLSWFFKLFGSIPIESGPASRESLDSVAELLNKGEIVCLFPEGAISRNGHLGEFKHGYERACEMVNEDIQIVPFYLRGLWGSQFSRSAKRIKPEGASKLYRDIIVSFGDPLPKTTKADVLKRRVFDLSISAWDEHVSQLPSLPNAWIDAVKRDQSNLAIADSLGTVLSGREALTGASCLSRKIKKRYPDKNVGVLLPTSAGGVLSNMAILMSGKVVVNLNFTASEEALMSSIEQADIKTVITSIRFLKKLEDRGLNIEKVLSATEVVDVEEMNMGIGKIELALTMAAITVLPSAILKIWLSCRVNPEKTAVILFSSGSEGAPKGVMLSHKNIMANLKQTADVLDTREDDVVMASLPLFHAFGLTVTQFMPLIEGLPMICHPDATDVLGVSKMVCKYRATVICATSTFLRLFARNNKVHPLMLDSLRIVVAGAERLNEEARDAFQSKFNKNIYEGYGATETTPVASVNLPDCLDTHSWKVQKGSKVSTVGMPLPGTSFKIVDPDSWLELGSDEDGMILIGGAQVMQGYLNNPEKTSEVIRLIGGTRWYVTGDKGRIDKDGFLTIIDRYSRFAKIGGEMISLSLIEQNVREALDQKDVELVAVSIADERKGEKILILIVGSIDSDGVKKAMRDAGCNALMIPSRIVPVDDVPKLGSGKTDFSLAKTMAMDIESSIT
ncbi:MAG: acyl-[acyl-carrier-protein]-phospholipid O-acyltransferase [Oceanicoccus sp.]|jgi:acyl-[acyl-carrier-protein]-phospholipid O-acyltransferase/long-chain-fatty-acid--[acyl-carrier-protein] ligase